MNYITKIMARGLKSGDFEHTLERVNLFTGKSAAGKTARIDALRLALNGGTLLGRASDLKARTIDIMGLARNGHIEVEAVDDAGRKIARRWKEGKACVIVADEIPQTPDILMDPNEYLMLSDAKKIEYAFNLYRMEGQEFTSAAIVAELKNIRLEHNTEDTEKVINEIVDAATGPMRPAKDESIQGWLANFLSKMKQRLSNAEADTRRMTATVQGITQLLNVPALRDPASELANERAKATKLLAEKQMIEQQLSDLRALISRREVIQKEILGLQENPLALHNAKAAIEELEADIARIEAVPADVQIDEVAVRAELDALNKEIGAYRSSTLEIGRRHNIAESEARTAGVALIQFKKDSDHLNELHKRAMEKQCCAVCGADRAHWKESKEQAEASHAKLMEQRKGAEEQLAENERLAAEKVRAEFRALRDSQAADEAIQEKRLTASQLTAKIMAFQSADRNARNERERILAGKRVSLEQSRKELDGWNSVGAKRAAAEARLAELSLDGKQTEGELMTAVVEKRTAIEAVQGVITLLEKQQRAYLEAKADEKRNAQALVEHGKAKMNVEVTKAAIEKLEGIQAKMVEVAFGTILKTVNLITEGLIVNPIEYRDGEIGRWIGDTWVKHESFSGTEKALTYAGISLALAKEAPIKIVMIDELGRLDPFSLGILMGRMLKLTREGVIGQFVGALSTDQPFAMVGVNTINL